LACDKRQQEEEDEEEEQKKSQYGMATNKNK
jgi:hypothetical protein